MFLVKFQAFTLDESHHLLVKSFFCESACENLGAVSACSALGYAFFAANIAVEQEVIMAAIMIAIFIFTRFA